MSEHTEKNIAAIDLGTSKMSLTVARANGKDVEIVYYREIPSDGVKYSGVWNVVKAQEPLQRLIQDAEESLDIKITQAVIGMPKYPVRQETNSGKVMDRGEDTEITAEDIDCLKRFAQETYPLNDPQKEAIYGAVAQSFSDGEYFQLIENDIIGMTSDTLEGHFKIFIGRKKDLTNADNLLTRAGVSARKKYFTAETTAKAVLSETEMENGVALIDFGGGSTSVTIYHDSIMRHYASIPFGGKSITHDIKSELEITERLAENIKLAFGACMPDKLQSLSEKVLHIRGNGAEQDKQVAVKYISEVITARVEEILQAILYEINESGLAEHLRSGIVVTGGCAQLPNLGLLIGEMSGYKVRTGYPAQNFSFQGIDGINDTTATTSLGLIQAALEEEAMNCTSAVVRHTEVEEAEEPETVVAEEVETAEVVYEEETPEVDVTVEEPEQNQEQDIYYDPEFESKEHKTEDSKPLFKKLKIFWGSAVSKFGELSDKADEMIDDISR
ncbi:MAG: cell division protein FtsA [Bacteroidales bacterium]|nr:cell division protein FtsA [Bacteroidales bacterium]